MTKYVDADKLAAEGWFLQRTLRDQTSISIETKQLRDVSAADVKPVVKGRWISRDKRGSHVCSVCGDEWVFNPDHGGFCYCPTCGADMRGGEKE